MLFTGYDDDNQLAKELFNIGNDSNDSLYDVLEPSQGLNLGNMFASEYDRYKDYRPRELKASSEQDAELLKIRELSFALNDLNLKLDVDPNNSAYYSLFKKYATKLDELKKAYSNKYDALEACLDLKSNYTWYKSPWTWEVDQNV